MSRFLVAALLVAASLTSTGCLTAGAPAEGGDAAAPAQPGLAAQGTILGLQTYLMLQQQKANTAAESAKTAAEAEKLRARATAAGSIMASLAPLRTEPNCAKRMSLANAVSSGLQANFPNYASELSLGTNLVNILASGMPGCAPQ